MSRQTIEAYSIHRWKKSVTEAWTALESGASKALMRARVAKLDADLKDITPTLETRGHREMLADLVRAVDALDDESGVHDRPVEERRYDLGYAHGEEWEHELAWLAMRWHGRWQKSTGNRIDIATRTRDVTRQYVEARRDGESCWVRRTS